MKHEYDYVQGGKTSVKIHNAPGGNSQWSIGWGNDEPTQPSNNFQKGYKDQVNSYQSSYQKAAYDGYYGQVPPESVGYAGAGTGARAQGQITGGGRAQVPQYHQQQQARQDQQQYGNMSDEKTSVKVHAPPGGVSSFSFGFEEPTPSYKQSSAFRQQDMNKDKGGYGSEKVGYQGGKQQNQIQKPQQQYQPSWGGPSQGYGQQDKGYGYQQQSYGQAAGGFQPKQNKFEYQQESNPMFGGGQYQKERSPPRQSYQYNYQPKGGFGDEPTFGQRVEAGNNCGPTTEKSSVKLHAPPGGKSSIQFF